MKLLIIEDEKITRISLSDILRREGFEVFSAEDGEEGLEIRIGGSDIVFGNKGGKILRVAIAHRNQLDARNTLPAQYMPFGNRSAAHQSCPHSMRHTTVSLPSFLVFFPNLQGDSDRLSRLLTVSRLDGLEDFPVMKVGIFEVNGFLYRIEK